jgi:hypothetical protein
MSIVNPKFSNYWPIILLVRVVRCDRGKTAGVLTVSLCVGLGYDNVSHVALGMSTVKNNLLIVYVIDYVDSRVHSPYVTTCSWVRIKCLVCTNYVSSVRLSFHMCRIRLQ